MTLERVWGTFRFNVYFFMGVIGHVLAALLIYIITGQVYILTTDYLNFSLIFCICGHIPGNAVLPVFCTSDQGEVSGTF